jgi:hypothetical protein
LVTDSVTARGQRRVTFACTTTQSFSSGTNVNCASQPAEAPPCRT